MKKKNNTQHFPDRWLRSRYIWDFMLYSRSLMLFFNRDTLFFCIIWIFFLNRSTYSQYFRLENSELRVCVAHLLEWWTCDPATRAQSSSLKSFFCLYCVSLYDFIIEMIFLNFSGFNFIRNFNYSAFCLAQKWSSYQNTVDFPS